MSNSWLSRRAGTSSRSWPMLRCHFCLEASLVLPRSASIDDEPSRAASSSASTSKQSLESTRMSTGDPSSWFCSACSCWNRRDERQPGGMATWDPAMADESANQSRLELRGKRPASQLSSSTAATSNTSPFCHTCSTNQSLVLSLLANYLPDPSSVSPEEMHRLQDELPAYRRSIEQRYPPLCDRCQPIVTERLQGADKMVRSSIWAAWLERSRKAEPGGTSSSEGRQTDSQASRRQVEGSLDWVWRLRGALWLASQISGWLICVLALLDQQGPSPSTSAYASLLAKGTILSAPLSLLWIFWNPRWLSLARLHRRGQRKAHINVSARRRWVSSQGILFLVRLSMAISIVFPSQLRWLGRNVTYLLTPLARIFPAPPSFLSLADRLGTPHIVLTALAVQPLLCAWAYGQLQIRHGSMVQLSTRIELAKPSHVSPASSPARSTHSERRRDERHLDGSGVDPISALSLGGQHHNPIFGQPSMPLDRLLEGDARALPPGEEMDWQPTTTTRSPFSSSSASATASSADQGFVLGPQRFFPPESITGVEELFGSVLDLGSSSDGVGRSATEAEEMQRSRERSRSRFAAALVVITAVLASILAWAPVSPTVPGLAWSKAAPASWRVTVEAPPSSLPPLDITPVALESPAAEDDNEAPVDVLPL